MHHHYHRSYSICLSEQQAVANISLKIVYFCPTNKNLRAVKGTRHRYLERREKILWLFFCNEVQAVFWKQTQRRRGVFREPLMLLLKLLWRASVSTWAWTPSQTSALRHPTPPVPSNQSTFLINCIQIGRHLLERASEKTCFPPRLSSILSSLLFLPAD